VKVDPGAILGLLRGETQADRVLPPSGRAAAPTLLATAVLAFLAVIALALVLAAGRLADRWGDELATTATVRLPASGDAAAQVEAALRVLEAAPGVADARALDPGEQAELLAPWFGRDLPLDLLPVPRLIAVTKTGAGIDAPALRQSLAEAVPGAVLDDHSSWGRPLARTAMRLGILGWLSLSLIVAGMAATIMLAAQGLLSANVQVVTVLRMLGARDGHIARAFMRRVTAQVLAGAAIGAMLGLVAVLLMPGPRIEGGVLAGLGFRGWHWLWPLVIPPVAGGLALIVTGVAARRKLEEMP
jgi:cell division transport system permease protein